MCKQMGISTGTFFVHLGLSFSYTIIVYYQIYLSYHESKQSLDDAGFAQILQSDTGRQLFKSHLVQELSIENYYFWRAATEWRDNFKNMSEGERENKFIHIYLNFFDAASVMHINVGEHAMVTPTKIAKGQMQLSASILDESISMVENNLRNNSWPRFRESNFYQQFTRADVTNHEF
mmetsp:Transcript_10125/g.11499  ORF Transcript_10125/g.11499 Transcript_10125/m.11499 type:complete len:177 (-) Transcript_10125:234-764(-)